MNKYVLRYRKIDNAKYISHLDFLRTIQRAMRRAGLPLKYSEGFNPHPNLSFALPLAVGVSGENELFEIELTEQWDAGEIVKKLNEVMPEGIEVTEAKSVEKNNFSFVTYGLYEIEPENMMTYEQVQEFLGNTEILIEKKTKKGVKETNIKPDIAYIKTGENNIYMMLAAGNNSNLKPMTVVSAIDKYLPGFSLGFCRYKRLYLADGNGEKI